MCTFVPFKSNFNLPTFTWSNIPYATSSLSWWEFFWSNMLLSCTSWPLTIQAWQGSRMVHFSLLWPIYGFFHIEFKIKMEFCMKERYEFCLLCKTCTFAQAQACLFYTRETETSKIKSLLIHRHIRLLHLLLYPSPPYTWAFNLRTRTLLLLTTCIWHHDRFQCVDWFMTKYQR